MLINQQEVRRMPGRDGTGPSGFGKMTGRGLGYCTGANAGRFAAGYGRGLGLRAGFGCRRGRFYNAAPCEPIAGEDLLSAEREILEARLKAINKHLDKMKKNEE
jgi:hypothetical protein